MSDLVTQGAEDAAEGLLLLYTSLLARIGVGDGATVKTNGDTTLAGTNTQFNAVTAATRSSGRLTYTTVFTSSQANFTWREICVDRTTRLLVRKVLSTAIGPKDATQEWTLVVNIDFTPG